MTRRAFTLIELLVVSAISLMLMTIGATVYMRSLGVYEDGQGLTEVYETSKIIERDLRDYLGNVAPVKGAWITSTCRHFPGGNYTNARLYSYYTFGNYGHGQDCQPLDERPSSWPNWKGFPDFDLLFSGPQYSWNHYDTYNHIGSHRGAGNSYTAPDHPANWGSLGMAWWITSDRTANTSWWPPAFFGNRDGTNPTILEKHNVTAGSWGWPRPDYRLDADADDLANRNLISCWFYAEDRAFNSPLTLALDNPNLVLASIKFSKWESEGREFTQLSFLKHHISGFDHPGRQGAQLRADLAYGNMVRAVKITPCKLQGGRLVEMNNADLGVDLRGRPVAGGNELPRCFDVEVVLQHPTNFGRHKFAFRYYNLNTPK